MDERETSYPIMITIKPRKDRYAQSKVIGGGTKESGESKGRKPNASDEMKIDRKGGKWNSEIRKGSKNQTRARWRAEWGWSAIPLYRSRGGQQP